jgi:hypothetical protein
MPFKSQAQRRKFAQLLVEGKISPDTFEEWNRETGRARLPERVTGKGPAKKRSAKTARKNRAAAKSAGKTAARKKTARKKTARRKRAPRAGAKKG